MNLRKNAAAKLTAVAAALFTLLGTFVLVHRNPPASDAASQQPAVSTGATDQTTPSTQQTSPGNANAATGGSSSGSSSNAQSAAPSATKRTHTRTHAS